MSSENVARRVALDHGCLPVNPALRPRFFSRLFRKPCTFTPAGFFISPAQPVTFLNSLNGEGHVLVLSGGWALTASWIAGHQSSAGYRAAFPPIPTRSNASLLSLSFLRTIPARARSAPFVPLCPEVTDLLEIQHRWFAVSDDCLSRAYAPWQTISSLSLLPSAVSSSRDLSGSQVRSLASFRRPQ